MKPRHVFPMISRHLSLSNLRSWKPENPKLSLSFSLPLSLYISLQFAGLGFTRKLIRQHLLLAVTISRRSRCHLRERCNFSAHEAKKTEKPQNPRERKKRREREKSTNASQSVFGSRVKPRETPQRPGKRPTAVASRVYVVKKAIRQLQAARRFSRESASARRLATASQHGAPAAGAGAPKVTYSAQLAARPRTALQSIMPSPRHSIMAAATTHKYFVPAAVISLSLSLPLRFPVLKGSDRRGRRVILLGSAITPLKWRSCFEQAPFLVIIERESTESISNRTATRTSESSGGNGTSCSACSHPLLPKASPTRPQSCGCERKRERERDDGSFIH